LITKIRRVVTGKDEYGRAVVVADGPAENVIARNELGTTNVLLWVTDSIPASIEHGETSDRVVGLQPPPNGTIFRMVHFAPEKDITSDSATRLRLMRERGLAPEGPRAEQPRHPSMHRTKTLDYAVILTGEIDMLLDDADVHLTEGDVVVQRATNHAWVNRSDKPCTVAFIMIDAEA
jgi:hypothetical protein